MEGKLLKKLKDYNNSNFYPFHMPGHKRNEACNLYSGFYQYDITEIDEFDNLHQPEGILEEVQKEAAMLYSSEETYFLINGSTSGILSAISAVSEDGGSLLIARNCHKSVYHGAFLNRMKLYYLYAKFLPEYGISGALTTEDMKKQLEYIEKKEGKMPVAVIITSPTYDGICSDICKISDMIHSYGIPLIVDQAHGAHLGFHPAYPEHAVAQGADVVIQSVHKTLPAPTQTALIHKNGQLVDSHKLQKYLRIYQSSSPSYPLMAGIEEALVTLKTEGYESLEKLANWKSMICKVAEDFSCIKICPYTEPGKIIISGKESGVTGVWLYDIFREKYHLQMEMCSASCVTAILTIMDREEGVFRLINALKEIDALLKDNRKITNETIVWSQIEPVKQLELWKAYRWPYEEIALNDLSKEFVAAEFINLYPPGIPLIVPGEIIDKNIVKLIGEYLKSGYNVQGIENNKIKVVKLPPKGECYEKD